MTPASDLAAVVMAGGIGSRMKSATPKHLHPILGRRMVDWIVEAARPLGADPLVVVVSPETKDQFTGLEIAVQETPRGTGDAVAAARAQLEGRSKSVLVLSGDTPLLTTELLADLVAHHKAEGAGCTVLSFVPHDIRSYGRVVRDDRGLLKEIVEAVDASPEVLALREANSSIYVFESELLWPAIAGLDSHNAQGELYLTDAVRAIVEAGHKVAVHIAPDPAETEGVNTRVELAEAAAILRDRINRGHMLNGCTIVDPASTWIDPTVQIDMDTIIHPFTVLRGTTVVRQGAEVGPHAVAVDAEIGCGATAGPFCYLRPGTVLGEQAKAGTFVEIKNSRVGRKSKVPHLSYIGDAEIGENTNIGAGAITANFPHQPGQPKGRTTIGSNVRTGIHNGFEAPITIGDGAWVAGGSYLTDDVPPGALALARERQINKEGRARGESE